MPPRMSLNGEDETKQIVAFIICQKLESYRELYAYVNLLTRQTDEDRNIKK